MCGFAGFFTDSGSQLAPIDTAVAMARTIAHRGPDDEGVWVDAEAGIALAHRRLSILDLSPAGHQPMWSARGRWVIAYNGEIYNHLELRAELEANGAAPQWRGHSDTETLLASLDAWGVVATLARCVGMFAFAAWDRNERRLWLARDRLGEKPLYYGWQGNTFLFGSELKALRAHPAFKAEIERDALILLLRHNYIPAPYSIYRGIYKLPAGTWLRLEARQRDATPMAYWSLRDLAERSVSDPFQGSEAEAIEELSRLLGKVVAGQRIADVPLGALLSGGIDSSLITATMQSQSTQPIRTFTIGFNEKNYDEASYARAIATHLGTEHTELIFTGNEALGLIPKLPVIYDEPFADSSQLPTHLVMQLARRHVTVALSGDGGDETFGGYHRYFLTPAVWRSVSWMPKTVRRWFGSLLTAFAPSTIDTWFGPLAHRVGVTQLGDKVHKLGNRLRKIRDIDELFLSLVTEWPDADGMVIDAQIPPNLLGNPKAWPRLSDPVARMMAVDSMTYLPDDILVKVDRAAMAVSLETRAPFLDHRLVEFAWRLPMSMKLRNGQGKWILRQLLERHVPRHLFDRPKMGFGIPLDQWLRGPLRAWAGDLLSEKRLRHDGYLRPEPITRTWNAHLRGEGSYGYRLWSVLMFQAWLLEQGKG